MKAVLVIDMPSDLEIPLEDIKTEITVWSKDVEKSMLYLKYKNVELKPLPSKKETDIETDLSSGDDYISGYKDGYKRGVDVGWNRCVSEMSGGTE